MLLSVLLILTSERNLIDGFSWPISAIHELPHFSDIKNLFQSKLKTSPSHLSVFLSSHHQLEDGSGLGTCAYKRDMISVHSFFLDLSTFSTGWWFRSLGAQRTKLFKEGSIVIRGCWQMYKCWPFLLWGVSVGFVRTPSPTVGGPLPRAA